MSPLDEILGKSPAIVAVRDKIARLLERPGEARRLPPVLIQGETGTGKGLLARALHRAGPRRAGPFVDVNCAAIPETLLEAEMFGFERGAFTDARQAKAGLFQTAHRGTIFLDEVGLLPEGLQAKLLKALEEQAVRRLGATRVEPVDVWVVAATSEDLGGAVRGRRFREDLYHRLAVLTVELPPLRARGADILLLAEHLLGRACGDYQLPAKRLDGGARQALLGYRWPGNIRELSNVMERVALLSEAPVVTADTLGLPLAPASGAAEASPAAGLRPLGDAVGSVERAHLLEALEATGWNVTRTAALLGISRNTLRYRMEKHGLGGRGAAAPRRAAERAPLPPPAAPLPAAPAPAMSAPVVTLPALRWERRRLTVLRAELVSPREERLTTDASRQLEALVDKVQTFDGRVEELSPRGILAVFGVEPVEDAPRRAALAAMAMRKALEADRWGEADRLAVKLAIHFDQFTVGRVGGATGIDLEEKRAAWDVLDALASEAERGQIQVSAAAAPFLERRFALVPASESPRAGGRTYRLVGRERPPLGPGGRITRFVGRGQEIELLRGRLAAARQGRGQIVGVAGEPGIGKSRLLFEFRQGLEADQVAYLEGRCLSYGRAIPYLPLLEMLRTACGVSEADPPELVARKVRERLEGLGMEPEEASWYLLHLLGVKEGTERLELLSPETIKARTFETLGEMTLRASRQQTIVLALEDLHWGDRTSEELLGWLVERLAGASILLLATYRPGYRPQWLGKSYATQIALQPLSREESLHVVGSVLETQQVPDAIAQLILARAEGNPFFLEELARAFGGGGGPRGAVPETIQEVILARIDRLAEEPRRLLQRASVLGREFPLRLLQALWDGPGGPEGHLQELVRLEFLRQPGAGEEPVYAFEHALTQEVAYESLLPAERKRLHAAAGRALEALHPDRLEQVYDRLAYHYARTDEASKAVAYLTGFAKKAARGFAHAEAVAALGEALERLDLLPAEERDARRLDIVPRLTRSLAFQGRFQDAVDLLLRHEQLVEQIQNPAVTGRYYLLLANMFAFLGDRERTTQSAHRAIEEARRSDDRATMGQAFTMLGMEAMRYAQFRQGVEYARQAIPLLEGAAERPWLGRSYWVLGANYGLQGEFEQALEAYERAYAIGESTGDPRVQGPGAWGAGMIRVMQGEWDLGIEACQRALELASDPFNRNLALGSLGFAYLEKGEPARAIQLLEQSVQPWAQSWAADQGWFTICLAEAYLLAGEVDRAGALAARGLEITRQAKFWFGVGLAERVLGRVAQARGDLLEAQRSLTGALERFASAGARYYAGRLHLDLAALAGARGDRRELATHLEEASRAFGASRVPPYLERTRALAREHGVSLTVADT